MTATADDIAPEKEEQFLIEQRRLAEEARAERARERLEAIRRAEIQQAREAAGLCVFCGRRLSAVARLLRSTRHRGCTVFIDPISG
jgi:hypothetical protein